MKTYRNARATGALHVVGQVVPAGATFTADLEADLERYLLRAGALEVVASVEVGAELAADPDGDAPPPESRKRPTRPRRAERIADA